MRALERAFDKIKEAFELVAQDEAEKMSSVQEIMLKSTDYLRRIIAPVGGQGGVTMSYLCPNCNTPHRARHTKGTCTTYCAVTLSTGGVYSSKDVRQSRSRPSRLSCQGPSGVVCFCELYCRMH